MRVALYVRVSASRQVEKDLPIPSMIKELKAYAGRHGMEVLEGHIYIDGGKTGMSAKREAFQRMIETARGKPKLFDAILVWKFSRFARNREDSIIYKALLKKKGIQVISINEPVDDSPVGGLLEGMIEVVDEFYSRNLGQDIQRGKREAAGRGFHVGGAVPYGYKVVKVLEGKAERAKLEIDEAAAPIVREIFDRYMKGEGTKNIASDLNRRGVRAQRTQYWSARVILQILENEKLAGTMYYRRGKAGGARCENAHPALISREVFERVQKLKQERRGTPPATLGSKALLSGLVRCAACGSTMYALGTTKTRKVRLYRCRNYHEKGKYVCTGVTVSAEAVENAVLGELKERFFDPKRLGKLAEMINSKLQRELDREQEQAEALKKELASLKARRAKLYEALETGALAVNDLAPRLQELNGGIKGLEEQVEKLSAGKQGSLITMPEVRRFCGQLKGGLEGPVHTKRSFLAKLVDHVSVGKNQLDVVFKVPLKGLSSLQNGSTTPTARST